MTARRVTRCAHGSTALAETLFSDSEMSAIVTVTD